MTRRAFTLVELISVIVIMGAIAAVMAPLIAAAAQTHEQAASQRAAAESLGSAMERIVRVLRETPAAAPGETAPAIMSAGQTSITLTDGHALQWTGQTLWLTAPGEAPSPLCQAVTNFELRFLAADGVTDTVAAPSLTQRIEITLARAEVQLRTCVFLRIAGGGA